MNYVYSLHTCNITFMLKPYKRYTHISVTEVLKPGQSDNQDVSIYLCYIYKHKSEINNYTIIISL